MLNLFHFNPDLSYVDLGANNGTLLHAAKCIFYYSFCLSWTCQEHRATIRWSWTNREQYP